MRSIRSIVSDDDVHEFRGVGSPVRQGHVMTFVLARLAVPDPNIMMSF